MNTLLRLRGIFVNFYNCVYQERNLPKKNLEMVIIQVSQFHYLCIKFCMDLVLDYVQFAEWNVAISHCLCMRWLKELNEFEVFICNVSEFEIFRRFIVHKTLPFNEIQLT